jgi:hypothetical protein
VPGTVVQNREPYAQEQQMTEQGGFGPQANRFNRRRYAGATLREDRASGRTPTAHFALDTAMCNRCKR